MTLLREHPDVARKALELRSVGARVTEVVGGRGTHPVASVAGGLASPLSKSRHGLLVNLSAQALALATDLVETSRSALLSHRDLLFSLPLETHYLGTVKDGALDLYDGDLRLRAPDGSAFDFSEDDWARYLVEEATPGSYGKQVSFRKADGTLVPFRVGALARLNCADRIPTARAQAELERFREVGGFPCHQTVLYHWARLVELLYAAERLADLVADPEIVSDDVRALGRGTPRGASAHVEAPRGVLVHQYDVDGKGIVTRANLLVATQQNLGPIGRTISQSVEKYLDGSDEALLNGIEFGIRCYDPCLSCATHRLGDMKLAVTVRQGGVVVREARR